MLKSRCDIMKKIKELVLYVIFGVLTTVVAMVTFSLCNKLLEPFLSANVYTLISNVFSWICAVTFAYITNKLWVFESKSWAKNIIKKEIPAFAGARLVTLGIEEAGMLIMITWLGLNLPLGKFALNCFDFCAGFGLNFPNKIIGFFNGEMMVKLILQVIVVILNYIFSKLVIFKNKDKAEKTNE
ncbi:MAG: GtrA family protein [Ruminococcus sp.]|nr:GtrA family protein [Candidatus Copronaster equi]